ncbi:MULTISPECIES: type 1 glutamine amidotransferase family protein [Staphylococcus]|nr:MULTISPECIES: type 1 glutamine amidotransferase family protein [Staphylococcus]HJG04858.1 glutamine amidotransferase [Megamonas funiformis]MBO3066586.1 glutamine amidotransferase [Staphylococcus shinii]PTE23922.1 glutamine amidotransferase [Staphylococcus equorum]QQT24189.1 glutamine amidotransferase [Staphylococcus equorum]RIL76201.1 glutamine amidotransferase [Staphylococcus cohnii]
MKNALFLLLDEFADWEGSYLSSTLNQSESWSVKTISVEEKVVSLGGFSVLVDYVIGSEPKDYDLLIMIGGNSWDNSSDDLLRFVQETFNKGIPVGAICGAVDYLAKNGFLNNYKHTGNSICLWSDYDCYTSANKFIEKQAVKDGKTVTANGTAPLEFTELVLKLIEFDAPENIEKTMFINRHGFYNYCEKYGNPFL